MSDIVTFERKTPEGTINFGIGQPSVDLLPVDLVQQSTEDFLRVAQPLDLNYGSRPGDPRFRNSLANFLAKNYGQPVSANNLFLTCGNSQALDFVCAHFSNPGDTIIVEEPSYFLAFQIFRDRGLNIVSVPVDHDGIDMDLLEEVLSKTQPALLYTIPSFQNPSGHTLSAARRQRLVELSERHNFLILADEVYQLLHYEDPPPDALGTMSEGGTVFSLGSFSKILAPGLRLGWIQTSNKMVEKLTTTGAVNSGGSLNHFTSHIVRHAIDLGLQQTHLESLRTTYGKRVEAMDAALRNYFCESATWTKPDGGYFFWLQLNNISCARDFQENAKECEVGFYAGELFSSTGKLENFIRLSFAHYDEADINKGIERLQRIFN